MQGDIKTTVPEACIVGCSIPLSKDDFLRQLTHGHNGNFIAYQLGKHNELSPAGLWDLYEKFAETMNDCLTVVSKCGVTVIRNFGKADLDKVAGFDVFTLFAHYDMNTNEMDLADGVIDKTAFADAFPDDFHGILDLTVCNAIFIRDELRKQIGNQIISFNIKVPIIQLMLFYKNLILNLKKVEINYIECYKETISALTKN